MVMTKRIVEPLVTVKRYVTPCTDFYIGGVLFRGGDLQEWIWEQDEEYSTMKSMRETKEYKHYLTEGDLSYEQRCALEKAKIIKRKKENIINIWEGPKWKEFLKEVGKVIYVGEYDD